MELQAELTHTLERVPSDLGRLSELLDPAWIEQTLGATGKASIRRRKLPAEHVVWLVIGLALFRNLPIWHVVRQLDLTLGTEPQLAPSAAIQGRQRLGDAPLEHLFRQNSHRPGPRHIPAHEQSCTAWPCWPLTAWSGRPRIPPPIAKRWAAVPTSMAKADGLRCVPSA